MEKIRTLFERDWEGNRGVINKYVDSEGTFVGGSMESFLSMCVATEKVDGTNVRLTVRNHMLVRLEKRRNPSKVQKQLGIKDPWYIDADEYGPDDKYIWEAARNTDIMRLPDGEWSGEAVGPKIQGNPLHLGIHSVVLFSDPSEREYLTFEDVPTSYEGLRQWLPKQASKVGHQCWIEGIVWWFEVTPVFKIKTKDFK